MICTQDKCGRPAHADGLCESHYRRVYRHGEEAASTPIRPYGQNSRQVSCRLPEADYKALEREAKGMGLMVYGLVQKIVLDHIRKK